MIGDRIRTRRIELDLTQSDIATKLNVSYQTISKYERYINQPDIFTLSRLTDLLNCSFDYLVGRADSPYDFVKPIQYSLTPEEVTLLLHKL